MHSKTVSKPIAVRELAAVVVCGLLAASCSASPSYNAAITLAGQVEDEDGNPLEGVSLSINKSRVSLMEESFLASDDSNTVLADGRFRVSCRKCSGVRLHFDKAGYYSETKDFHVEKVAQPGSRMNPEVAEDLVRTDLRIVLRSAKNKVKLVRYRGFLRSAATGPVTVLPLRLDLGTRGVEPERLTRPPDGDAQYLPGHVTLVAALTDAGELAEHPYPERPGAQLRVPAAPVIDFSAAGGGVILDQHGGPNKQVVYRTMRTAPADGYQDTISIATADRSGDFYFYCRIGDLYGKGVIGLPTFDHVDGQEVVQAYIEIRLNPDGSRNVETAK
ncbi:MAG: hypothetical protein ACN4GT_01525 [Gammaproteobacteria bacterium]